MIRCGKYRRSKNIHDSTAAIGERVAQRELESEKFQVEPWNNFFDDFIAAKSQAEPYVMNKYVQ